MAPANAYSDMGPTDGLITIMERAGKGSDFPPRPAQIRLDPRPGAFECAPPDLNTQMLAFRDSGRIIYAFIALGSRGPQKEAAAILNSLRVSPASG